MKKETVKIWREEGRYTSDNGTPTCTWDEESGEVCGFFECSNESEPGFCRACGVTLNEGKEDGGVVVIPCSGCPVWFPYGEDVVTKAEEIEMKKRAVGWARAALVRAGEKSGLRAIELAAKELDAARDALLFELADSVVGLLKPEEPASDAEIPTVRPTTLDALATRLLPVGKPGPGKTYMNRGTCAGGPKNEGKGR